MGQDDLSKDKDFIFTKERRNLMKKLFCVLFVCLVSLSFAAIVQQNDFTSGENGTLPSNLGGSYDAGTDVSVQPLASISPAPSGDHAGGDGYALRVGDINTGGGYFNFAFPNPDNDQTDCKVSAWVYIDWTTWDATPLERDYLLCLRQQAQDPQTGTYYRQGYMFAITSNSSWAGISPNPTSKRPFIMKRVDATSTLIGTEGSTDVDTGWHKIAFQVVGTELKGFVDDVQVCSGTDSQYASGSCAIGYYEENGATAYPYAAAYDNFIFENTPFSGVNDWALY